ncbi:MAG: hypothetical protein JWN73_1259 [Betaproteobacteria bacterium]|nr:hypothetical protein [Betaproteobacteria bacterium]
MTKNVPPLHAISCDCGSHRLTRRNFLAGGAALAAGLAAPAAWAQERAKSIRSIRSLRGLVRVNGERVNGAAPVRVGDSIATGADGRVSFVVGSDAFFLRENSELKIESSGGGIIDSLRMLTGALGSVFGKRASGQLTLHTPTVTAGIRGTGCYTEVRDAGVYFCTCFGAIQLTSLNGGPEELVVSSHHDPRRIMRDTATNNMMMIPASFGMHTDQEMDALEKLVGRRAPWAS